MPTARLRSLATAVPPHILGQEEVIAGATELFAGPTGAIDERRLRPIFEHTQIEKRHSCVPLEWYLQPHDFRERNDLYVTNAVDLLEQAAREALDRAGLEAGDIDTIVTVSTSGIATPSLDARLMNRLPFRADVARLPVFGLGCAGGVLGLSRAASLARADPDSRVLLLVVELCGLTFRYRDRSKSNIVAAALFGDGAAAGIVDCGDEGLAIRQCGEHTWRDSLDIMGWDVGDDGLTVLFSRDIPTHTRDAFAEALGAFLDRHGLSLGDFDSFVPHPGGAKVLDALEEVFGLPAGGLSASREVLRRFGNMSAVTVLFVLERALAENPGARRHLLTSLGPGFTGAFAVLEAA
jgi:alkylresorcinol/alkylpyrone synthase